MNLDGLEQSIIKIPYVFEISERAIFIGCSDTSGICNGGYSYR